MQKQYKRPESILVVIYTVVGEVLMIRRKKPADFWQSVTGSLNWGESPRHAAQRELYEETGLRASGRLIDRRHSERFPIIWPWRSRYAPGEHYNVEHWFSLQLPGRRIIRLNPEEHVGLRWVSMPQAIRLASSWTNRDAIIWLFSNIGLASRYPSSKA